MTLLMRKIVAKLLGWKVVTLVDLDGEILVRFGIPSVPGYWYAYRFWLINRRVALMPDGTTLGLSYVTRWELVYE